jgi:hypothetical protein
MTYNLECMEYCSLSFAITHKWVHGELLPLCSLLSSAITIKLVHEVFFITFVLPIMQFVVATLTVWAG